ncbi:MAG: hypothetical protein MUE62_06345 [Burkholderiaceae bacterium]|jgi:hypothetical protein|nr:hypothetical protein [Burkholderiaceae bacterium]
MLDPFDALTGDAPPPPDLPVPRRVVAAPREWGDPIAKEWERSPECRRTRRWQPDEFVYVDGMPLVYSATAHGVAVVHLPGGGALPPGELAARGHSVVMPLHVRIEE